jgi:hypothetical protein
MWRRRGKGRDSQISELSGASSQKMREVEACRIPSITPTREQVATMLANLLANVDSETSTSDPTRTSSAKSGVGAGAGAGAGLGAGLGKRCNALSPSKQKRLHQLVCASLPSRAPGDAAAGGVQRYGQLQSQDVFEALQKVAGAENEVMAAKAIEALRDILVRENGVRLSKMQRGEIGGGGGRGQVGGGRGAAQQPVAEEVGGSRPQSGPPEKLHKHLRVHQTHHLKHVASVRNELRLTQVMYMYMYICINVKKIIQVTSPLLMQKKLDEFGLLALKDTKAHDMEQRTLEALRQVRWIST